MFQLRKITTLGTAAVVALAILAAPASAGNVDRKFSFVAQIDCGDGPRNVGSPANLWAPLVDLRTGENYIPVAWKVSGTGFSVDVAKGRARGTVVCSYDDGEATGTVTVKRP